VVFPNAELGRGSLYAERVARTKGACVLEISSKSISSWEARIKAESPTRLS